jgi:hypothetical protein
MSSNTHKPSGSEFNAFADGEKGIDLDEENDHPLTLQVLSPSPEQALVQLQDRNGLGTKRNINVMLNPPAPFESSGDDDDSTAPIMVQKKRRLNGMMPCSNRINKNTIPTTNQEMNMMQLLMEKREF